jgi:hypothetical protein
MFCFLLISDFEIFVPQKKQFIHNYVIYFYIQQSEFEMLKGVKRRFIYKNLHDI